MDPLTRRVLEVVVASEGEGITCAEVARQLERNPHKVNRVIGDLMRDNLVDYRRRPDRRIYLSARSIVYVATLDGARAVTDQ